MPKKKNVQVQNFCQKVWENDEDDNFGGHDLVRIMDRQGEVLIMRRKCSVHARQRMGSKLMNCCKPEPMGTPKNVAKC